MFFILPLHPGIRVYGKGAGVFFILHAVCIKKIKPAFPFVQNDYICPIFQQNRAQ
jgi:hypothetical protein